MTNKELWIKSTEEFNQDLWLLDKYKSLNLYKLIKVFNDGRNDYYDVTYHLWDGDEWVCVNKDYVHVYKAFDNRVKDLLRGDNVKDNY